MFVLYNYTIDINGYNTDAFNLLLTRLITFKCYLTFIGLSIIIIQ